jgi:nitronate monooxygenase
VPDYPIAYDAGKALHSGQGADRRTFAAQWAGQAVPLPRAAGRRNGRHADAGTAQAIDALTALRARHIALIAHAFTTRLLMESPAASPG